MFILVFYFQRKFCKNWGHWGFLKKNPKKLAAAAVYLSCRKHECEIDIYKMVKIVETSSATIKAIARELNDKLRLGISL